MTKYVISMLGITKSKERVLTMQLFYSLLFSFYVVQHGRR